MLSLLLQKGKIFCLETIFFKFFFIPPSGVNRMTEQNWSEKFNSETYSCQFRFAKADISTLIAALRIPPILHFPNGYRSNRL